MKWNIEKAHVFGGLVLVFAVLILASSTQSSVQIDKVRTYVCQELDSSRQSLYKLRHAESLIEKQKNYLEARKHFKKIAFFLEHVSPRESKLYINGALVPKHDDENGRTVLEPNGFQFVESQLFADQSEYNSTELIDKVIHLDHWLEKLANYYAHVRFSEAQVLDMMQLEHYRMVSLNLAGFDATLVKNNVQEAIWSLEGMRHIIQWYPYSQNLQKALGREIHFLRKDCEFETINRLEFIRSYVLNFHREMIKYRNLNGFAFSERKIALRLDQEDLFSDRALNTRFFSLAFRDTFFQDERVLLGKYLFFEPLLSGNNERSCASCHRPEFAYAENLPTSRSFDGEASLNRNAPSLLNVAWQQRFFHDGRSSSLEEQSFLVLHNQQEMNSSLDSVAKKLNESSEYRTLFEKAFGSKSQGVSAYGIQRALAEFQRSLISMDSPFDEYLSGKSMALENSQKAGFNLFMGKALCGTCHFFPLFNGTVPPYFTDSEFEIIGTPADAKLSKVSADSGRYNVTKLNMHVRAIKTPGVRNISKSSPYMHNGVFNTLDEVLSFYNKGGGQGHGYAVEGQTLPFDQLKLNETELAQLKSFLLSLEGKRITQKPDYLPRFSDGHPYNQRKVGGLY